MYLGELEYLFIISMKTDSLQTNSIKSSREKNKVRVLNSRLFLHKAVGKDLEASQNKSWCNEITINISVIFFSVQA